LPDLETAVLPRSPWRDRRRIIRVVESEGERVDRQIVDMRIAGKSEGEISRLLGVTIADVHRAVDAQAPAALSAQNRVWMIYLQSPRLEELEAAFMPQAKAGDGERRACGQDPRVASYLDGAQRADPG
jgi:hypothetical protein